MHIPIVLAVILALLIAFAVVAIAVATGVVNVRFDVHSATPPKYASTKSVLTAAERSFVGVLEPLLPEGVRLLVKIRLADLFFVAPGPNASMRTAAFNRISAKHVDFLLVRANDFSPLGGIELDDSSHASDKRRNRDAFVDRVFSSAGIPLLHIPARSSYNTSEIRTEIQSMVENPAID